MTFHLLALAGILVGLALILLWGRALLGARHRGVLTGGDLGRHGRVERAVDPERFDRHLADRVRATLPVFVLATASVLLGGLSLWLALNGEPR